MKHAVVAAIVLIGACSSAAPPTTTAPAATSPVPSITIGEKIENTATTSTPVAQSTQSTTTATTTAAPPPKGVSTPGIFGDRLLTIRLRFRSDVADVTTSELQTTALTILNSPSGWNRSGFGFVSDDGSDLTVILAEGPQVDDLCLPLNTGGIVNCQNGPVVALNADRWRSAFDEWDSTIADYRTYVINHEVGHLIGLRHPRERCPTAEKISALMEPQTTNLQGCVGNGIPLDWEIEWANKRPTVIGPDPSWDGPRPTWPLETEG